MAEPDIYGKDSGSYSHSEDELSNRPIDPWCDLCFDDSGVKIETTGFCSECNSFICEPCFKAHRKSPASKKHEIMTDASMPKSQASKPVKYHECKKHSGNMNENFCLDHGKMACSLCTKEYHGNCNTSSIVNLLSKISSSDIKQLKDSFSVMKKAVSSAQISLRNNITDIECQRKAMSKKAEDLRDEIIQLAQKLYLDTVPKITDFCNQKTTELANHVSSLDGIIHAIDKTSSDIDKTMCGPFGPNQFMRLQDIIENAQRYRTDAENSSKLIHKIELSLSFSSELSDILNSCSHLIGNIVEVESKSDLLSQLPKIVFPNPAVLTRMPTPKPAVQTSMSIIKRKQREISDICVTKLPPLNVNTTGDNDTCAISGNDITSSGHFLLADYYNRSVKILSPDNQILSSLSVAGRPTDITVIDDNTAAVSTAGGKIPILDISDPTAPSIQRSISLGYWAYGITVCNNNLVVTCWHPSSCVKMIDMTGQELWSAAKDHKEEQLFNDPWYVATQVFNNKTFILVTEGTMNTLTVLDAGDGKLIRAIDVAGKRPCGITTDDDGNVYVCYRETREICAWSGDLTQCRMLLSGSDLQQYPRSIGFSNTTNELIVAFENSDSMYRFRLSESTI